MSDFRSGSPTSDIYSDGFDSLSMRDKTLLKRSVSKHHNNNFKAGYVPVHEQYLQKTGLRGRKTFAFWTLVGLLFILAVGNLILTITILGVLRIGYGMQSVELLSEDHSIKFYGDADLGHIYKRDGKLESFLDYPLQITSYLGSILFKENFGHPVNKLEMLENGTTLKNINSFEVKTKDDRVVFSPNKPSFHSIKGINHMKTEAAKTNRIVSHIHKKLRIEGDTNINLKGAEGTKMEAKQVIWSADQDIYLQSSNGIIVINSADGVFIGKVPEVMRKPDKYYSGQYKICVCMPEGKLFKIPVPNEPHRQVSCDQIHISERNDPCK